eukprot:CAMPEP_0197398698 /NCGR_PEP_ID=MMETSP1165-20131217/13838_1 /TAXON_ID=284809 /ORGANISM="Chrysocystis fragilis, Strain CCMP3189" /LENGTH=300 /DNA_ID=CAMNT_0042924659 /DNA_START=1 /DNA_END=903 /DNA_ORIENTATION=+
MSRLVSEAKAKACRALNEQPPPEVTPEARFEEEVVREHNFARERPREYAKQRVEPLLAKFKGKRVSRSDGSTIETAEGRRAVEELLEALGRHKACEPLRLEEGLTRAAQQHADDIGCKGLASHDGSDGSTAQSRMSRHGEWWGSCGESLSFGFATPQDVVLWLLVDDGVPSRGHRKNALGPKFAKLGCSRLTPHASALGVCVVLDYAVGFGPPKAILDKTLTNLRASKTDPDTLAVLASLPHGLNHLRAEIEAAIDNPHSDAGATSVSLTYAPGSLEVTFVLRAATKTTTKTQSASWEVL